MPFNTITFVLFLTVVVVLYHGASNWSCRKGLLLGASYLFYAAWNPPFVLLLLFATAIDWWLAQLIDRTSSNRRRRVLLGLSLLSNLGLLGYFKYGTFLAENFIAAAALMGWNFKAPDLDIVLPMGISFYTFQSLSYTIDVYRRRLHAQTSFSDFALFVSFFPQLVAGPIVRAVTFLPQLLRRREVSADQFGWGVVLFVLGLFQKIVLADTIFAPVVDSLYAQPQRAGPLEAWAGVLGFSGQIFCDFAGYSTCAIGLALCFGFELPDNFRAPYAAIGFSDFWRRWHISLSSWLRDFLYISLGGNRQGDLRTSVNLLLTMLIGGLWHGASWMFVLWGGLHGLYLLLERPLRSRAPAPTRGVVGYVASLATFLVVTLTWIPFRADNGMTAFSVARALFDFDRPTDGPVFELLVVFSSIAAIIHWHWAMRDQTLEQWFGRSTTLVQTAMVGSIVVAIFFASGGDQRAFIYFQF